MTGTVAAPQTDAVTPTATAAVTASASSPISGTDRRPHRALVVLHDAHSSPGYVGEALREQGWVVRSWVLVPAKHHDTPGNVTPAFPDTTNVDLVVVLGAPWSAHDERIRSWLRLELDWLAQIVHAGGAVFGVCFGAQVLALALGGMVTQASHAEIGWYAVDSEELPTGPWFQWHMDQFTSPPQATAIAVNSLGTQAFRFERCLGVQWHPEVQPTGIYNWIRHGGATQLHDHGREPAIILADAHRHAQAARARAHALVEHYLTTIFPARDPVPQ